MFYPEYEKKKISWIGKIKRWFVKDKPIVTRVGELIPPPQTPAAFMMIKYGYHVCLWIENWVEYTKGDGALAFPHDGSFYLGVLRHLRKRMQKLEPKPRPAQFESLTEWEEEAYERERHRPGKGYGFRGYYHENHDDRMQRWRQANVEWIVSGYECGRTDWR